MKYVLKRYDSLEYALIYWSTNKLTPFVCAWKPTYDLDDEIVCWGQGHYFMDIEDAIEYMKIMKEKYD